MIACVQLPDFAALIQRQTDPALTGVPLLLVKYGAKRSQVVAVSPEAAAMGAAAGMSLSRARGACPTAHCVAYNEGQLQTARDRLLAILWDYTNRVEVDEAASPQTAIFYLDLGTLRETDLCYLGEHLRQAVTAQFGAGVAVGLASGKFPALLATYGHPEAVTLVPRHQEAAFVAPYPVSRLPVSKETARRLSLLCLREIGHLAALPREAVVAQFGREGKFLYGLAQGLDGRPVKPRQMPKRESVSRQFDDLLRDRARIDVVLHHLAEALALRLEKRQAALHEVTLTVHLEDGSRQTEHLHLLAPAAGSTSIARVLQQLLERIRLKRGIVEVEICAAHLVPNIARQLALFTHRPGRAELLDLARILTARHGECFYEVTSADRESLLPERRFRLLKVDAS